MGAAPMSEQILKVGTEIYFRAQCPTCGMIGDMEFMLGQRGFWHCSICDIYWPAIDKIVSKDWHYADV